MSDSTDKFTLTAFWVVVTAISIIICSRFLYIASLSDADLVMYMPDDAYYYLNLARNHAEFGTWTFDGGLSGATGFHLLQGYQSALIARISPQNAPIIAAGITTAAAVLTVLATLLAVKNIFGYRVALLCSPVFLAYPFIAGSSSGMEWGWCILTSALLFLSVSNISEDTTRHQSLLFFGLGLVLELSRSDAGATTGSLFLAALIVRFFHRNRVQENIFRCTFLALLGSVLGLIVTLAHTWALRGSFASGSSEVKLTWAQHAGMLNCVRNAYRTFLQVFGVPREFNGPWLAICTLAVVTTLLSYALRELYVQRQSKMYSGATTSDEAKQTTLMLGSIFACALYFVLFSMNAAVLFWYCALITVPLIFVLAGSYRLIHKKGSIPFKLITGTAIAAVTVNGLINITKPTDPHQKHMHGAALQMAKDYPNQRFGAWNAGIFGYFSPIGNVVNLDGLVNDEAIPHIKNNTLPEYIRKKEIGLLVDFTPMITEKSSQKKGGYDTADFRNSVSEEKIISPTTEFLGSAIGVFEFQ